MSRVQIVIRSFDESDGKDRVADTELDSASVEAALLVSDSNLKRGTAELFADGKRIARLTKRGSGQAPFWELG